MKKIALLALVVLNLVAWPKAVKAVWDSTGGNMPNAYPLCWGAGATACLTGNSATSGVAIGGTTAPTSTLSVNGTLNVTGATTLTGNTTISGSVTAGLPIVSTTALATAVYPLGQPIWVEESVAGSLVTNAYNLGVSTGTGGGACV